jgi:hypothetical protein
MKKLEEFMFLYFSKETEWDPRYNWLRWVIFSWFMFWFILGAPIPTIPYMVSKIAVFIFTGSLVLFAIPWIIIWFYHNRKIKKGEK